MRCACEMCVCAVVCVHMWTPKTKPRKRSTQKVFISLMSAEEGSMNSPQDSVFCVGCIFDISQDHREINEKPNDLGDGLRSLTNTTEITGPPCPLHHSLRTHWILLSPQAWKHSPPQGPHSGSSKSPSTGQMAPDHIQVWIQHKHI